MADKKATHTNTKSDDNRIYISELRFSQIEGILAMALIGVCLWIFNNMWNDLKENSKAISVSGAAMATLRGDINNVRVELQGDINNVKEKINEID